MTALAVIELNSWSALSEFDGGESPKAFDLIDKFPNLFEKTKAKKDDVDIEKVTTKYGEHIIDDRELQELSDLGVKVELKRFKGTLPYRVEGVKGGVDNLHVHLPNNVLVGFDKVTWLEDACTEELQKMIDEGWRMICVCPPLNKRRPDYILGKTGGAHD